MHSIQLYIHVLFVFPIDCINLCLQISSCASHPLYFCHGILDNVIAGKIN